VVANTSDATWVHEFGHGCNLQDLYGASDIQRIMYGVYNPGKNVINDAERAAFEAN
jgi:hypothetical protein